MDNFSSFESNEENLQLMCGLSHSRSKSLNVIGARVVIAHKHKQLWSQNKNDAVSRLGSLI